MIDSLICWKIVYGGNMFSGFVYIVIDLVFYSASSLQANQSLLLLLNDACLAEKQQIPIV